MLVQCGAVPLIVATGEIETDLLVNRPVNGPTNFTILDIDIVIFTQQKYK